MLREKIQLEADEIILAQVRKHWFVLALQFLGMFFGALAPLFVWVLLGATPFTATIDLSNYTREFVILYSGWLVLIWMAIFGVWTNYYLDVWTVTNKRLITVDQRGLFNRHTGSFRLERLQDINVTIRGMLATVLGFGDLHAETASGDQDFIARGIPDPQGLKALILKASDDVTFVSPPVQVAATAAAPQQVNDGL